MPLRLPNKLPFLRLKLVGKIQAAPGMKERAMDQEIEMNKQETLENRGRPIFAMFKKTTAVAQIDELTVPITPKHCTCPTGWGKQGLESVTTQKGCVGERKTGLSLATRLKLDPGHLWLNCHSHILLTGGGLTFSPLGLL
ncbi:hypothetical protein L345_13735, partial [Ophiophagus hannah]